VDTLEELFALGNKTWVICQWSFVTLSVHTNLIL